uniref:SAC domain-containing protein n=1 Tax=Heterorhabditis bacteriophora TaxID=37862 RepID=A0A1I7WU06_HETBA
MKGKNSSMAYESTLAMQQYAVFIFKHLAISFDYILCYSFRVFVNSYIYIYIYNQQAGDNSTESTSAVSCETEKGRRRQYFRGIMPIFGLRFASHDEDERVQKNTFTKWINFHLEEVCSFISAHYIYSFCIPVFWTVLTSYYYFLFLVICSLSYI